MRYFFVGALSPRLETGADGEVEGAIWFFDLLIEVVTVFKADRADGEVDACAETYGLAGVAKVEVFIVAEDLA